MYKIHGDIETALIIVIMVEMSHEIYDLSFTVTMFPREAKARALVSREVEGVNFEAKKELVIARGVIFTPPSGHVIGITSAVSEEALMEFNIKLRK